MSTRPQTSETRQPTNTEQTTGGAPLTFDTDNDRPIVGHFDSEADESPF